MRADGGFDAGGRGLGKVANVQLEGGYEWVVGCFGEDEFCFELVTPGVK